MKLEGVKKVLYGINAKLCYISVYYRRALVFMYSMLMISVFVDYSYAADPVSGSGSTDLISAATNLINDVKKQIIYLSSGAAAIGVGIGGFMKKFSMGKQDRVEAGNKLMRDTIIAWAVINSITFILDFVGRYTSDYQGTQPK